MKSNQKKRRSRERIASSQCTVETREYDGDLLHNPVFEGGGFIGQLTLEDYKTRCVNTDSKGRSCVAIEWSDGGQVRALQNPICGWHGAAIRRWVGTADLSLFAILVRICL